MNNTRNTSFTFSIIDNKEKLLFPTAQTAEQSWKLQNSMLFDPSFSRIWIVLKGRGHVITNLGRLDIVENNAYFLPPNSIISTALDEDMLQYYIDFYQSPNEIPIEHVYEFHRTANANDVPLIYNLAKSCEPIYKNDDPLSRFKVNTIITTLLSLFVKDYSKNRKLLDPAIEYIGKHYSQPISLVYLANLCNYSPEYFSMKFKQYFGVPPQKFIIFKRLAKAKVLLRTTTKTIREIGEEIGYPDQIHFSKLFSKMIGISPLQYRSTYH